MRPWARIPRNALRVDVGARALRAFISISFRADNAGWSDVSLSEIAEEIGVDRGEVVKLIKALEHRGLVKPERRRGGRSWYYIVGIAVGKFADGENADGKSADGENADRQIRRRQKTPNTVGKFADPELDRGEKVGVRPREHAGAARGRPADEQEHRRQMYRRYAEAAIRRNDRGRDGRLCIPSNLPCDAMGAYNMGACDETAIRAAIDELATEQIKPANLAGLPQPLPEAAAG